MHASVDYDAINQLHTIHSTKQKALIKGEIEFIQNACIMSSISFRLHPKGLSLNYNIENKQ